MKIINFLKLSPRISIIKTLYYSLKFKGIFIVGKKCRINIYGNGKVVFNNKNSSLYVGVHFSLCQGATLDIYDNGILNVGKSVGIYRGTKIVVREEAQLSIGNNTFINENSRIQCAKKISIGDSVSISWNCNILDSDLHGIYIEDKLTNPDLEVLIGNKVWVCANTIITKGVIIDNNCIIGSNSVVTRKHLKSNNIYAGNPLRLVKQFDHWGSLNKDKKNI